MGDQFQIEIVLFQAFTSCELPIRYKHIEGPCLPVGLVGGKLFIAKAAHELC